MCTMSAELGETRMQSWFIVLFIVSYGMVVFAGVIGNTSLVITLCSASSVRMRNPLLLALCVADLFVSGISAPFTIISMLIKEATLSIPVDLCKAIHYIQIVPVAASTISLLMLSLDRYATVKHPRLAQLRQARYLHVSLAFFSWILAATTCLPYLYTFQPTTVILSFNDTTNITNNIMNNCEVDYKSSSGLISYIVVHTIIVFILPGLGVLLNHCGVRRKLCTLSLTARAKHGELPLPMPILRRPTHVIIVTGLTNVKQGCKQGAEVNDSQLSSEIDYNRKKSSHPISPRAMREIRAQQQRQRISSKQRAQSPATPGIPLPKISTLQSRKKLANMLIVSSLIFIGCWMPHVFCIFYTNFGQQQYCSDSLCYFNLLLGYLHSAISPIIYWALNHNSLNQSPFAPLTRLRSMQNFFRSHLRTRENQPHASSTNEAALGPFNPKLIKTAPRQYRAQASSHYLY